MWTVIIEVVCAVLIWEATDQNCQAVRWSLEEMNATWPAAKIAIEALGVEAMNMPHLIFFLMRQKLS